MATPDEVLAAARTLLVDWPSRSVPAALARAGFTVPVRGGPGPAVSSVFEIDEASGDPATGDPATGDPASGGPACGEVSVRRSGERPGHADVAYVHRPLAELPGIIALVRELGDRAIWSQSGRDATGARDPVGCWLPEGEAAAARAGVEAAGRGWVSCEAILTVLARIAPRT